MLAKQHDRRRKDRIRSSSRVSEIGMKVAMRERISYGRSEIPSAAILEVDDHASPGVVEKSDSNKKWCCRHGVEIESWHELWN